MKKPLFVLLIGALLISGVHLKELSAEPEQKVIVTFKLGSVWLYRGENARTQLKNRSILQQGDRIVTDANGKVRFRYGNDHEIRVHGNAEIKVGSPKVHRSNMLMVVYGKIRAKSLNEAGKSQNGFKVVTPTSVCAVRGTDFNVNVTSNGTSSTEVNHGWVDMNSGDNSVALKNKGIGVTRINKEPEKKPATAGERKKVGWLMVEENKKIKKDPDGVSKGYQQQNQYFQERSQKNASDSATFSDSVSNLNASQADEKDLKQMEQKKQEVVNRNEDDYYRNEIQGDAIQRIIRRYKEGKEKINQAVFDQVKRNSDSIAAVQEKNMENIRKILEDYEKKKGEILQRLDETRDKVKGDLDKMKDKLKYDFDKVKPQMPNQ